MRSARERLEDHSASQLGDHPCSAREASWRGEVGRRRAPLDARDLFGRARRHAPPTALVPAARAEVDDPVGADDRVEVVLDQHDGVAGVDEPVELAQQQRDVRGVQPGRRLVEQVEGVAAPGPLQLGRQLDPLGLPAAELGGGLTEAQVAEPDLGQGRRGCATAAGTSARKSAASSTDRASTSATFLPR